MNMTKSEHRDQPSSAAIGILCKTPCPGRSKTRLIPLLGTEGAAELAGCFLRDIVTTIFSLQSSFLLEGYVVYAPEGSEETLKPLVPPAFRYLCCHDFN